MYLSFRFRAVNLGLFLWQACGDASLLADEEDPKRLCGAGPDLPGELLTVSRQNKLDYPLSAAAGMCQWGPWQLLP